MPSENTDPRIQKAFGQLQTALNDPALSNYFDAESREVLMRHQELMLGWGKGPVSRLEEAVSELAGILKKLEGAAGDVERKAVKAASKAASDAVGDVKSVVQFVGKVETRVEHGATSVAHSVASTLAKDVLSPVEQKIAPVAKEVFERLPYQSLIKLMLREAEDYEKRLEYVMNSLYKLERAVTGNKLENSPFKIKFKTIENDLVAIAGWVFRHTTLGMFISLIEDPTLKNVVSKIIPLPPKVEADFLHVWLTEKGVDPEEREFRKQLVACVDHFVRDHRAIRGNLAIPTGSSAKNATNLLSDFLSLLFSCVGGFAFRHPNVPSPTLPKLHWAKRHRPPRRPFDGADVVSTGVSRSISYAIKGAVGTIGRGAWEINAHNDALIEGIASGVASLVGALIQSLLHDLFWAVEIREIYNDQQKDALAHWPSVPDGEADPTSCWGVTIRTKIVPQAWAKTLGDVIAKKEPELVGLLHSYTAYMDAIRPYTDPLGIGEDEKISIDSYEESPSKLVITYECTSGDLERCPVIRAYCNGAATVMTPDSFGAKKKRTYTCAFDEVPPEDAMAYVRSGWGGSAAATIKSLKPKGTK